MSGEYARRLKITNAENCVICLCYVPDTLRPYMQASNVKHASHARFDLITEAISCKIGMRMKLTLTNLKHTCSKRILQRTCNAHGTCSKRIRHASEARQASRQVISMFKRSLESKGA